MSRQSELKSQEKWALLARSNSDIEKAMSDLMKKIQFLLFSKQSHFNLATLD
jgi:hypothetical protein